uniref:Uncharacterized protein n=1 Tax=viral metagenome TaxID=1070528 RepID=A0A6C0AFT1_9ZZZZ
MSNKKYEKIKSILEKYSKKDDGDLYLTYFIKEANKLLEEKKNNEAMKRLKEDLLLFFEDDLIDEKNIDDIYKLPLNIKDLIENLSLDFEYIDDSSNYIKTSVNINGFIVYSHFSYKIQNVQNSDEYIEFRYGDNIIAVDDEELLFSFLSDSLYKKESLDNIYNEIKKNKNFKKIYMESKILNFEGFMKLLFLIPKIFYGYLY